MKIHQKQKNVGLIHTHFLEFVVEKLITVLKSDEKMEKWAEEIQNARYFIPGILSVKDIIPVIQKMGEWESDHKERIGTLQIGAYHFTYISSVRTQSEKIWVATTKAKIDEMIW